MHSIFINYFALFYMFFHYFPSHISGHLYVGNLFFSWHYYFNHRFKFTYTNTPCLSNYHIRNTLIFQFINYCCHNRLSTCCNTTSSHTYNYSRSFPIYTLVYFIPCVFSNFL